MLKCPILSSSVTLPDEYGGPPTTLLIYFIIYLFSLSSLLALVMLPAFHNMMELVLAKAFSSSAIALKHMKMMAKLLKT